MNLSKEEIERVAQLARVSLTDAEKESLGRELSRVLDYFQTLRKLDTSTVNLDLAETETANSTRADESRDSGLQKGILDNAPMREGNFIKVKSVF